MNNNLLIAGAGTGKTTFIINKALAQQNRVLITTYTIKCRKEIEEQIISKKGYIPDNIVVQTWFSFLLEHGIHPYKKDLGIKEINGLNFVNGKSGIKYINKQGIPICYSETEFDKFYFDNNKNIFSDKLPKLVLKINETSNNSVFDRISKIFDTIYIDEVQDLVGYDLEIVKKISENQKNLFLVGDPRQKVYDTHVDSKFKKYNNGNIDEFIKDNCEQSNFYIDTTTLNTCRRCHKDIVIFMNNFYKKYDNLLTNEITYNTHQGIFVVRSNDVNAYLKKYCPIQLRYNKIKHVNTNFNALNYRETKGCTYDRTLIYPTKDLENYLKNKKEISKINTKNAIYVALSRAINSVAIVYDGKVDEKLNIKVWEENNEQ